ncbi:MAG: hypothetical protein HY811_05690 [Planctomycetes bacterium]|nr:hypothetical protein [Planctomycetota bacterium]
MLPHISGFKLNFIFDTNAVRKLGVLNQKEWESLDRACKQSDYKTGWIPRVLQELLGSNLNRKSPLTDADVAEIRCAVSRFGQLSDGHILPDTDELIKRTLYVFADKTISPSQRTEWRQAIDFFLREVTTAGQIESSRDGNSWVTILKNKELSSGWEIPILRGFKDIAKQNADIIAKIKAPDAQGEKVSFFEEWFIRECRKHQFSNQEIQNIQSTPFEKLQISSLVQGILLDHYYIKGTGIVENDYFDIDIATYLGGEASILVSDDSNLVGYCKGIFADNGRIMKFDEFMKSL